MGRYFCCTLRAGINPRQRGTPGSARQSAIQTIAGHLIQSFPRSLSFTQSCHTTITVKYFAQHCSMRMLLCIASNAVRSMYGPADTVRHRTYSSGSAAGRGPDVHPPVHVLCSPPPVMGGGDSLPPLPPQALVSGGRRNKINLESGGEKGAKLKILCMVGV